MLNDDRTRTGPPDPSQAEPTDADEELVDTGDEALGQPEAAETGQPTAESQIDRLRAEVEEAKDRMMRIQAELENYRKRVARQMEEERRYAALPLIRDLLPVWDNIGRAIEAAENTHQTASLLEGFKMVAGQLESVLERHHCTRIDALGRPFDPNLHEAISQQPSDAEPANTVVHVACTGFRLHDRVVRPSQVVVSTAVPEAEPSAQEPGPDEA